MASDHMGNLYYIFCARIILTFIYFMHINEQRESLLLHVKCGTVGLLILTLEQGSNLENKLILSQVQEDIWRTTFRINYLMVGLME